MDKEQIVRSFHYKDGWHFTLRGDGSVLISHTDPGKPSDFELVVDRGAWTSVMCNTTLDGETDAMWRVMQALRGKFAYEEVKP